MASLQGPLNLQKPGHQLSCQEWLLWKKLATREEAQGVSAFQRSRSGAQAISQATGAPLAHPPGTVKCTAIPASSQLLTLESHSISSGFWLLVSAPLPSWLSDKGYTLRPNKLTSRASQRLGEKGHV